MNNEKREQAKRYAIIAAICVFSTQFGVTIIAPLLGIFVSESENPYIASSLIFAAFTLVSMPLQIPSGILSDRFGRRKFIVAGLMLYAIASAMFMFFAQTSAQISAQTSAQISAQTLSQTPAKPLQLPQLHTHLSGLILARALQGAGAGLFFPAITALLTEKTSESEREDVFSIFNIGLGAGLTLGPIAGGYLTNTLGIASPFMLCIALAASSTALSLRFFTDSHDSRAADNSRKEGGKHHRNCDEEAHRDRTSDEKENPQAKQRTMMISCIIIFFGIGVAAIMSSVFSPFAKEYLNFSETFIGICLSAMLAVFSIMQHAFSMLLRVMEETHLAEFGIILCASGLAAIAFISDPPHIIAASLVIGAGLGAISLSTLTLASKAATQLHRFTTANGECGSGDYKSEDRNSGRDTPHRKEDRSGDYKSEDRNEKGDRNPERSVGGAMGVYYTMFYAGLGIIPLICGYISEIFSAKIVFLLYSAVLFAITPSLWLAGRTCSRSA
ncbi:hypothetical protein DRN79_00320 [Methanosarcinales archaeon]|nr:MAG: hypothetical protein DRN79_00320 [Methanosarcinales archaeon]